MEMAQILRRCGWQLLPSLGLPGGWMAIAKGRMLAVSRYRNFVRWQTLGSRLEGLVDDLAFVALCLEQY